MIGIHAVDRVSLASEYGRGSWGVLARQALNEHWGAAASLVLMGDFNADPYDAEVASRAGLFAERDRARASVPRPSPTVGHGEQLRPLYNPMWMLLPEARSGPGGTLDFDNVDRGIRWRLCDQILLSPDLSAQLVGPPTILDHLAGKTLLTRQGTPQSRVSDHLPVELRLSL